MALFPIYRSPVLFLFLRFTSKSTRVFLDANSMLYLMMARSMFLCIVMNQNGTGDPSGFGSSASTWFFSSCYGLGVKRHGRFIGKNENSNDHDGEVKNEKDEEQNESNKILFIKIKYK